MIGFTASILLGSALGLRLTLLSFLLTMLGAAVLAGAAQAFESQSLVAGAAAFAVVAAGLQTGYAAGIWMRSTVERRAVQGNNGLRSGRP
ncbi:MAG: hypothetical protein JWM36_3124 [Hyphomicrobiales bacterium]|nr:hypothetical protein [Hyphomicrobiales bacterium]